MYQEGKNPRKTFFKHFTRMSVLEMVLHAGMTLTAYGFWQLGAMAIAKGFALGVFLLLLDFFVYMGSIRPYFTIFRKENFNKEEVLRYVKIENKRWTRSVILLGMSGVVLLFWLYDSRLEQFLGLGVATIFGGALKSVQALLNGWQSNELIARRDFKQ